MKNILITGGAGLIGSNLSLYLVKQGHQIFCVDNLSSGSLKNLELCQSFINFHFIQHDVVEPLPIEKMLTHTNRIENEKDFRIDEIYHLACPASPVHYQKDPIQTIKTGVNGTMNILEIAKEYGSKILFTSTSEIYGQPLQHPQREDYFGNVNPIGIRSCYDESKRLAETLMFDYNRVHNIDTRVVRIFNTYGPNLAPDDGRVVSNFIQQCLLDQPLTIYGDGQQTRSLCFVDDMVQALVKYMELELQNLEEKGLDPKLIRGPINLGNPNEITMTELAKLINRLVNNVTEDESSLSYHKLPVDDPLIRKPNIERAKQILNWEPTTPLEIGLQKTISYFRQLNKDN